MNVIRKGSFYIANYPKMVVRLGFYHKYTKAVQKAKWCHLLSKNLKRKKINMNRKSISNRGIRIVSFSRRGWDRMGLRIFKDRCMKHHLICKLNIFRIHQLLFIIMNIKINLRKFSKSKNHKYKLYIIGIIIFKLRERF